MPKSKFTVNTSDLDSIFASGNDLPYNNMLYPKITTGFKVNGTDIALRYYAYKYYNADNTNFKIISKKNNKKIYTDINQIFEKKPTTPATYYTGIVYDSDYDGNNKNADFTSGYYNDVSSYKVDTINDYASTYNKLPPKSTYKISVEGVIGGGGGSGTGGYTRGAVSGSGGGAVHFICENICTCANRFIITINGGGGSKIPDAHSRGDDMTARLQIEGSDGAFYDFFNKSYFPKSCMLEVVKTSTQGGQTV